MRALATPSTVSAKPPRTPKKPPPIQVVTREHRHIAGLDASTSRTGYCAPNGSLHSIVPSKLPAAPTAIDLARRVNEIKHLLHHTIRLNPPLPTLFVYEAAFFLHKGTSARLDELRGVMRDLIVELGAELIEINNVHLKQFASGKSGADKTLMGYQAMTRIEAGMGGAVPANDDEADAWHLRALGWVAAGLAEAHAQYQLDAIEACRLRFP